MYLRVKINPYGYFHQHFDAVVFSSSNPLSELGIFRLSMSKCHYCFLNSSEYDFYCANEFVSFFSFVNLIFSSQLSIF